MLLRPHTWQWNRNPNTNNDDDIWTSGPSRSGPLRGTGRRCYIRELTDSHLEWTVVAILELRVYCNDHHFNLLTDEQLFRYKALVQVTRPFDINVVDLAQAVKDGGDCAFALHDSLIEVGCDILAQHFLHADHEADCWALTQILGPLNAIRTETVQD